MGYDGLCCVWVCVNNNVTMWLLFIKTVVLYTDLFFPILIFITQKPYAMKIFYSFLYVYLLVVGFVFFFATTRVLAYSQQGEHFKCYKNDDYYKNIFTCIYVFLTFTKNGAVHGLVWFVFIKCKCKHLQTKACTNFYIYFVCLFSVCCLFIVVMRLVRPRNIKHSLIWI